MVRDYKGRISVETIETLSCGKVPQSWTKPFDDSNLSDSITNNKVDKIAHAY